MIKYTTGDATRPVGTGPKMIVHVCNNVGGWGAGFVVAVSRRWKTPEAAYRQQAKSSLELGSIQLVQVEPDITVTNMVAQVGYGTTRVKHKEDVEYKEDMLPPIRYWALEKCLEKVAAACIGNGFTVHCPRIGCGLAGGKWEEVEKILDRTLTTMNVEVTVYDLP